MQRFQCDAGEFGIDEVMAGQTALTYYDPLAQIALQRSLRVGAILAYQHQGIEGLFSQIQDLYGGDSRMVKANPYYWAEYCEDLNITTTIKKSTNAVGVGGAPVTLTIDSTSHSKNGRFSPPRAGYRAYIAEKNNQAVNITTVTKTPTGAHTIVLTPINNEVLDLTGLDFYTLLVSQMRIYLKGDTNPITGGSFVKNPPNIHKGYIQMYEDRIDINQEELNGYTYDVEFRIGKGLNSAGKEIEFWDLPEINSKMLEKYMDQKTIDTLFNQRDDAKQQGFNGMVPSVRKQGSFNRDYDPGSGVSLKAILFNAIRQLRLRNGAKQNMLACDFGFGMDWTESIGQMVNDTKQNLNYSLFGQGGEGIRNFNWYNFQDFTAYNFEFKKMIIDTFDAQRYGNMLPNFAMVVPMVKYKDTMGNTVGAVTYVNTEAAEKGATKKIWADDSRLRGFRNVSVFLQDTWGMEIHAISKMGIFQRATC
jgi:hypothetical protein